MSEHEPAHGYNYSLNVVEIVCRLINFDQSSNQMPFEEVLDSWVEKAEHAYDDAQQAGVSAEKLEALKADQARRRAGRGKAMALYAELLTAAAEIWQGRGHQHLVLCRETTAAGYPEFTIHSLYMWAKECHGIEIPEWAPANQPTSNSSRDVLNNPVGAARGYFETASIIAGLLGRLVDKLVDVELIEHPTRKTCINSDDEEDPLAIAEYIVDRSAPLLVLSQESRSEYDVSLSGIANIEEVSLGLVAHAFCSLAEEARMNDWVGFRDNQQSQTRGLYLRGDQFVSAQIYKYLLEHNAVQKNLANQRKSAILQRLGKAKTRVYKSGPIQISVELVQAVLLAGHASFARREE